MDTFTIQLIDCAKNNETEPVKKDFGTIEERKVYESDSGESNYTQGLRAFGIKRKAFEDCQNLVYD